MGNNKSLLVCNEVIISHDNCNDIVIRIPSVGEILEDEFYYDAIIDAFTASPYSRMVQLDDMGIDFSKISFFDLFLIYAPITFRKDLTIIFGDTFERLRKFLCDDSISDDVKDNEFYIGKNEHGEKALCDLIDGIFIDEKLYEKIAEQLRNINLDDKDNRKPGNEAAKKYLIDKSRRYIKRHKNDIKKAYLEKLVISLVNERDYKYNYEETLGLSIYKFKSSSKQIHHFINFDKVTNGIYSGTVDTSKLTNKSVLNFVQYE